VTEPDRERYADPRAFAREVNLPLLGEVEIPPLPPGAGLPELLKSPVPPDVARIVTSLTQTRQSLTLRSLLLSGYAHDPELFALGLAIAREWGRQGISVALADLNFWSPAVVRPAQAPPEGLVDMLEFGCSFRRVAWEVVAERLWLVTPGSYLPDAERIVEHPDWDRVLRVLAGSVDVTIFVAPLLERSGFLGRLSKRMDGVIVGGSVERVPRTRLRDSFLELWGSDAPIIGCVGILPAAPPAVEARVPAPPPAPAALPRVPAEPPVPVVSPPAASEAPTPPTGLPSAPTAFEPRVPPGRPAAPRQTLPVGDEPDARAEEPDQALVEALTREALEGTLPPAARRRSRLGPWLVAVSLLVVVGGAGTVLLRLHLFGPRGAAFQEAPPTGTDQVLPAGLGAPSGTGLPASPDDSTAAAPAALPGDAGATEFPYHVHVASFRSEATVERIADGLRAHGLDAWYESAADMPGWYRVFVGRFATYEEAAAEAESLLHRGLVERAQAFPDRPR
jgi:SPOR domain